MSAAFFPDTTVLINFEIIQRWDLLRELVKDGASWVASVEDECHQWVGQYPGIHTAASQLFGPAIRPEPAELINAQATRREMADPIGDQPYKHLGEAETIVIVQSRFPGSRFITDDRQACAIASAAGIRCYGTGDLLRVARAYEFITLSEYVSDLAQLKRAKRFPQSYYL